MSFAHVTHAETRALLTALIFDEEKIANCLSFARECFDTDCQNPEVAYGVLRRRETALDDAEEAFNLHGDNAAAIAALRVFWGE